MICELLFSQMKAFQKAGESAEGLDQKLLYLNNILRPSKEELRKFLQHWKTHSARDDATLEQMAESVRLLIERASNHSEDRMTEVGTILKSGANNMRTTKKKQVTDRFLEQLVETEDDPVKRKQEIEEYKSAPSAHERLRKAQASLLPYQRQLVVVLEVALPGLPKRSF